MGVYAAMLLMRICFTDGLCIYFAHFFLAQIHFTIAAFVVPKAMCLRKVIEGEDTNTALVTRRKRLGRQTHKVEQQVDS